MTKTLPHESLVRIANQVGVPVDQILPDPPPGTATEDDLLCSGLAVELVRGTLVRRAGDVFSSSIAAEVGFRLADHAEDTGVRVLIATGTGPFRLRNGDVRSSSISLKRAERLRGDPTAAIPDWVPDLAVEVLSPGNTVREMADKRAEYLASGVREVWEIDPRKRTGRVYRPDGTSKELAADDAFEGGDILPGFAMRLADPIDAVLEDAGDA